MIDSIQQVLSSPSIIKLITLGFGLAALIVVVKLLHRLLVRSVGDADIRYRSRKVVNFSGDFPFLWDEIHLPIRYGSDYRLARDILNKAADEIVGDYAREAAEAWENMLRRYPIERARVDPMVTMVATDNWLEFTLRYTVDFKRRRVTKDRLFERIVEEVDKSGERVQFGSTTIELQRAPKLEVEMTNPSPR